MISISRCCQILSALVGFSSHILSVLVGSSWAGKKDLLGLFGPGKKLVVSGWAGGKKLLGPVGPVKNLMCPVGLGKKNCWVQLGREKTC